MLEVANLILVVDEDATAHDVRQRCHRPNRWMANARCWEQLWARLS